MLHINNEIYKSKMKLPIWMSIVFYSSFVCISAYVSVYFKIILRECLRRHRATFGVPQYCASTCTRSGCVDSKPTSDVEGCYRDVTSYSWLTLSTYFPLDCMLWKSSTNQIEIATRSTHEKDTPAYSASSCIVGMGVDVMTPCEHPNTTLIDRNIVGPQTCEKLYEIT